MIRGNISELEAHKAVPLFVISSVNSHLQLLQFDTEGSPELGRGFRVGVDSVVPDRHKIMDSQNYYGWKRPPNPSSEWTPLNHIME